MANGQQAAEQNLAAFIAWSVSKSDDDFREYVHRGKLKRSEIAAECGFGKSALAQNPSIKNTLEVLEERLRGAGVLPPSGFFDEISSQTQVSSITKCIETSYSLCLLARLSIGHHIIINYHSEGDNDVEAR